MERISFQMRQSHWDMHSERDQFITWIKCSILHGQWLPAIALDKTVWSRAIWFVIARRKILSQASTKITTEFSLFADGNQKKGEALNADQGRSRRLSDIGNSLGLDSIKKAVTKSSEWLKRRQGEVAWCVFDRPPTRTWRQFHNNTSSRANTEDVGRLFDFMVGFRREND